MALKILSFGDRIKSGDYALFSSFEKVLNFVRGKDLVSAVLPEIGPGPNNIVLSALPPAKKLKIGKGTVSFGGDTSEVRTALVYDSAAPKTKKNKNLSANLSFCRENLAKLSPALSMAFLFSPPREKAFRSGFEKKMLARMKKGAVRLEKGDWAGGAKALSGLGFGLTPSGDDFLGGFLLAANFLPDKRKNRLIREITKNCRNSNPVSRSFLSNCASARAELKTKNFMKSLSSRERKALKRSVEDLLDRGHTSGADFLSGFLFFFRRPS